MFDFDGVIVESNHIKTDAFAQVFAQFPEHAGTMMAFHHAHVSASRFEKFDYLLRLLGRPGDQLLRERIAAEFSAVVKTRMAVVPFVKGAVALLEELKDRVPVYLASVTPDDELSATLARRGLGRFFRGAYGCPPWTKAGAIRDILASVRCLPEDAVLIGDSAGDLRAAADVGVAFIARDSGLSFGAYQGVRYPDLDAVGEVLSPRIV